MTQPGMSSVDAALLFDGARLTLARQLSGLRKSELAVELGRSATIITAWETGRRPSAANLAELSMRLGVEPAFFAVTNGGVPVPTSAPHFRSLRSTSQRARDQAAAFGQLAVDVAIGLQRHVEFPESDVPLFPVDEDAPDGAPEEAARELRAHWKVPNGPMPHLARLMEVHGVLVVFSPPQAASVDAYSFSGADRSIVVLNSSNRDYYRQRFDLGHELGHLCMHVDAEPGGRVVETQAHRFASELLLPAEQIIDDLPTSLSAKAWTRLAALKETWGVSQQALLFRARQLGVLSDVSYRNAMITISTRGWRRAEPGQVQILESASLLPRAVELLSEAGFDESVLARECRAPLGLFRVITSRSPGSARMVEGDINSATVDRSRVVSLLPVSSA